MPLKRRSGKTATKFSFDAGRRASEFSLLQLEDECPGMEVAVRPDDVVENEVLPKLIEADLVVLVTSLYYYGINAALKAVTLISGYGDDSAFASIKLYFKQLLDYMRWQPAGTVLASDSWNGRQLAKHVQEAAELGHQFK
ncbi:flavodoxin family protein [Limosilactobacillus fermentum]|uniref:flavodoxin family protein n=1 Tax=Limosilactobacillus fermentum TaxID=1613 RepID=UPI003313F262